MSDYKVYDGAILQNSQVGTDTIIGSDSYIQNSNIAEKCRIERRAMVFDSDIGYASEIGYNSVIRSCKIGKFCSLSWGLSLNGANHPAHMFSTHVFDDKTLEHPQMTIGNDVWIGGNVTSVDGVTIGDGAIIGAGGVVTKDIPPYAVAVGNPAIVIKYRFLPDQIERLLDIRWWDWPNSVIEENLSWLLSGKLDNQMLTRMEQISLKTA